MGLFVASVEESMIVRTEIRVTVWLPELMLNYLQIGSKQFDLHTLCEVSLIT